LYFSGESSSGESSGRNGLSRTPNVAKIVVKIDWRTSEKHSAQDWGRRPCRTAFVEKIGLPERAAEEIIKRKIGN
jgi:hypothetical protein